MGGGKERNRKARHFRRNGFVVCTALIDEVKWRGIDVGEPGEHEEKKGGREREEKRASAGDLRFACETLALFSERSRLQKRGAGFDTPVLFPLRRHHLGGGKGKKEKKRNRCSARCPVAGVDLPRPLASWLIREKKFPKVKKEEGKRVFWPVASIHAALLLAHGADR